ncbi:MAG TPA: cell division protein ZipA C-terminal FtsZ-binding domain-containing protein [Rhodocyclaceae bacterium]|nr:cell division protein ZipA C-terminal FtsZ-binding domain-containing protein [Rhodocyclaceae bacterium]
MSDLQLSLLGMGAVLVIVVWAYNKLQERKYRKAAEKVFRGEQADVLAPEASSEVQFESQAAPHIPAPAERIERMEPVWESSPDEAIEEEPLTAEPVWTPAAEPVIAETYIPPVETPKVASREPVSAHAPAVAPHSDWCDSSIDAIARLQFAAGINTDDLRQAQATMQGQQRVHLRVFVQDERGVWKTLAEASAPQYQHVWFALQLVDRRGAVSNHDFEALRSGLQALCSLRGGEMQFPDLAALVEQSAALDEFCAQLDLQLALNVLDAGNGAFAGTKVRGLAEAAGMKLAANGEFQAHDDDGNFLFALANMGETFDAQTLRNIQTHGLTFFLDVPHVRDGGYAFERMLSTARQFTSALDASLVNAQRASVSDTMVDSIRKKIFEIHEQMVIAGIPAGGVRALRLFS